VQLQPRTCLTLRLADNPNGPTLLCYVIGPSRWGISVTVPLLAQRPQPLEVSTKLVAGYTLKGGKPVEFATYVLGYQQTEPPTMVLAQPAAVAERDRREFLRLPTKIDLEYLPEGSRWGNKTTHTVDISVGGVCMVTGEDMPAGTLLTLTMHMPDDTDLALAGRITWSGMRGRHKCAGVEFCNVSRAHENYLFRFVRELERSLRKMAQP